MIKGVVFDLDGVIVDSPKIYFKVMKGFLKKHCLHITDLEVMKLITFSLSEELEQINRNYSLGISHEEFLRETLLESNRIARTELGLVPGAKELLGNLKKKGFLLALASNNTRSTVDDSLKRFGLKDFFYATVCADDVQKGKPDPQIYLKAVEKLGLLPGECVGIEDSVIGVKSVKSAGLKCIACPNAFTDHADFGGADFVAKSLFEVSAQKISGL